MRIQSDDDIENSEKNQKIRNRESWLKVLVIAFFSLIIAWKLVTTPINIVDFKFTDLLALLLAIFSIVLSVAFYFKATETSNNFYDNTYKFTQDVHEILGRIEGVFGERLKHLNEGYLGLMNRFDRLPFDIPKAEKEVKQEEAEVKKKEEERNQLLESIMKKASFDEEEKKALFEKIMEKDKELHHAKSELESLKREIKNEESRVEEFMFTPAFSTRLLMNQFVNQLAEQLDVRNDAPELIRERFNRLKGSIPNNIIRDMKRDNILDSEGDLTGSGIKRLIKYNALRRASRYQKLGRSEDQGV